MLQEKLPEATEGDIGALIGNALITTYKSNKDDGTLGKLKEYGAIFNEVKTNFWITACSSTSSTSETATSQNI